MDCFSGIDFDGAKLCIKFELLKSIENQWIIKICIIQKLFYRDFFVLFDYDYKPTFPSIFVMGIVKTKIIKKVGRFSEAPHYWEKFPKNLPNPELEL